MVHLEVNGHRVSERGATAPLFPGRPNRLTVRGNRLSDGSAPWRVHLSRMQPDGRQTEQSVELTPDSPVRLVITEAGGAAVYWTAFYHTMDDNRSGDVVGVDGAERVVHLGWSGAGSLRPLDPPVLMQLAPDVLEDVDCVTVLLRSRGEELGDARGQVLTYNLLSSLPEQNARVP